MRLPKDSERDVRYLISIGNDDLSQDSLQKINTEYPLLNRGKIDFQNLPQPVNQQLEESPYILFDPLGNGILIYDSSLPSGELLKDLKKVLQNSKIG